MKILAFGASNSRHSINRKLALHAAEIFTTEIAPDAEASDLDLNDFEMPIYSVDFEEKYGIPDRAQTFYDRIGAADALIVSYAEHNGHYTVAFKNIFDWASRIDKKVFQDKPMVIMSASTGQSGAASILTAARESAGFFGANIRGSLSVGRFKTVFDLETGRLSDPELAKTLRETLLTLR